MPFMVDEFNGHKIFRMTHGKNNGQNFGIGMGKCRAILENIDAIREFVGDVPFTEPETVIEKRKPKTKKPKKSKPAKSVPTCSRFQRMRYRVAGIIMG